MPFAEPNKIFFAAKGKGTYVLEISDDMNIHDLSLSLNKLELKDRLVQKNILLESGFMTDYSAKAQQELFKSGFYSELLAHEKDEKKRATAVDRVTGGIFQTISGIKDSRQVILNIAASHQADYLYLLLTEFGADVIGQNGNPMYSTSNSMLALIGYLGDKEAIKQKYVEAMNSPNLGDKGYRGWNLVPLEPVCK